MAQSGRAPEVSAFDLSLLDEGPTPQELFFVREHVAAPSIPAPAWKLDAAGVEMSHTGLLRLPRATLSATLECAENPVGGGMVSHAVWEGTPLSHVLAGTPPPPGAGFVKLTGYDGFTSTIPLSKAMDAATLVVHRMNGDSLGASHGGPARLLAAGWYGMASVKWLQRIEYATSPGDATEYRRKRRSLLAGVQVGEAVTAVRVKSVFSRPIDGARIHGRRFTVRGAAWAGDRAVRSVEVSTDDGKTWSLAMLGAAAERYSWVHWQFAWRVPGPGVYALLARATDQAGTTQPLTLDSSRADEYERNGCQRITVTAL